MIKKSFIPLIFFLPFFLLFACSKSDETEIKDRSSRAIDCETITPENHEDCIRLNHIQVLGTHNSYKLEAVDELVEELNKVIPGWSRDIEYGHRSLTEQLEELGIRQLELDIFADPAPGGLYAESSGALLAGDEDFIRPAELLEPGYKVLHIQDIDYRSNCLTLISCLEEVKAWSVQNPNHLPLMIMIELKDNIREDWGPITFTEPVEIDESNIFEVDEEIRTVFEDEHIITPDDIRGEFDTLEDAILEKGWPTLAESRGKVLFALDNTGSHRDAYLSQSAVLDKRIMFVSSEPGQPSSAFIKMNNALRDRNLIRDYVERGYLVRTRSDIPTNEARSGDTTRREHALGSGAQYISTDYPEESPFGSGYIVKLPDAVDPGICNPVSAPDDCENSWITE